MKFDQIQKLIYEWTQPFENTVTHSLPELEFLSMIYNRKDFLLHGSCMLSERINLMVDSFSLAYYGRPLERSF